MTSTRATRAGLAGLLASAFVLLLASIVLTTHPEVREKPSKYPSMALAKTTVGHDDSSRSPDRIQLEEPLQDVVIEGNETIPDGEIVRHIKIRPGRPYNQKQIKDDVDALVRLRWFASVEPIFRRSDEGIVLVYRVFERPIVRRVEFKGAKKVQQKVFIALTQLRPGSPFDIGTNRECARRIEEYYHEKGFAFATVELEKGNDRNDREVVFLINEGPKVRVTKVTFNQNTIPIDGDLITNSSDEPRRKTRLFGMSVDKTNPSQIRDDIDLIKQYYHQLGYFDVDIKQSLKHLGDDSNLKVCFEIVEGVRYRIQNIEVTGNKVLSETEIRGMFKTVVGSHFSAREITADTETIKSKYGETGRIGCRVDAVPCFVEEEGVVDIKFKIDEGKIDRVSTIQLNAFGYYARLKITWPH